MVMAWWKLPTEEQPPPEIWGLDDEITLWFEGVEAERAAKYGTDGGGSEPMTTVPMDQNEYAKSLLANVK